jgi:hypothetical protein
MIAKQKTAITDTGEHGDDNISKAIFEMHNDWKEASPVITKYPRGFEFNRLRKDGTLEKITINSYFPSNQTFIVKRTIGELQPENEMTLKEVEAMTAPELAPNPVGTNVTVSSGGKKVSGKMAGYLKKSDQFVLLITEDSGKSGFVKISRELFNKTNFGETRMKVMQVLGATPPPIPQKAKKTPPPIPSEASHISKKVSAEHAGGNVADIASARKGTKTTQPGGVPRAYTVDSTGKKRYLKPVNDEVGEAVDEIFRIYEQRKAA